MKRRLERQDATIDIWLRNLETSLQHMDSHIIGRLLEGRNLSKGLSIVIRSIHDASVPYVHLVIWTVHADGSTCIQYISGVSNIPYAFVDKNPAKKKALMSILAAPATIFPNGSVHKVSTVNVDELLSILIDDLESLTDRMQDESQPIRRKIDRLVFGTYYVGDYSVGNFCKKTIMPRELRLGSITQIFPAKDVKKFDLVDFRLIIVAGE